MDRPISAYATFNQN